MKPLHFKDFWHIFKSSRLSNHCNIRKIAVVTKQIDTVPDYVLPVVKKEKTKTKTPSASRKDRKNHITFFFFFNFILDFIEVRAEQSLPWKKTPLNLICTSQVKNKVKSWECRLGKIQSYLCKRERFIWKLNHHTFPYSFHVVWVEGWFVCSI